MLFFAFLAWQCLTAAIRQPFFMRNLELIVIGKPTCRRSFKKDCSGLNLGA